MKNILCKLGFHKVNKFKFVKVYKQRGKHKYHRNYQVCDRCGKLLSPFGFKKKGGDSDA